MHPFHRVQFLPGSQTPATAAGVNREHKHLRRLDRVWIRDPIYLITTCTLKRARVLHSEVVHQICREVWDNAHRLYHWEVGQYVVMPDHVHFFCAAAPDAKPLSLFGGKWKEWTTKYLRDRAGFATPLWQEEFFDHVLRSTESYTEKWEYVWHNPVRAALVKNPEDWLYQGCMRELRMTEVEHL